MDRVELILARFRPNSDPILSPGPFNFYFGSDKVRVAGSGLTSASYIDFLVSFRMVAAVPFEVLGLGLRLGFLLSNGMGSELPRPRIRLAAAGTAKQAAAGVEQGGGRRRSVQACHRRLIYNHYFSLSTPNVTPQHRQML